MNAQKIRTYCHACGAELDAAPEQVLPTCADCAARERAGEPVYQVLRADGRSEGPLSAGKVLEQLHSGLLGAEDLVGGRAEGYLRIDQHPDFAPWFIPGDPRREASLRERAEAGARKASERRGRATRRALRAAAAIALVVAPLALWQAGLLTPENPFVARVLSWMSDATEDAARVVRKAVDEDAAREEVAARSGLPGDELLAELSTKWAGVPGDASQRLELARVGILQGTRDGLDSARNELEAAFVADPKGIEPITLLTVVYAAAGAQSPELRRASIALFQRASELAEGDPAVLRASAGMALAARAFDEAAEKARACLAASPEEPFCQWYLGQALVSTGRFGEATLALQRAADTFQDAPAVDLALGKAAMESHHYGRAREALDAFARRYPDDPDIHHLRGRLLTLMGEHDAALEASRRAVALGPDLPELRLSLGQLLTHVHGRHAEAWEVLAPLTEREPEPVALRQQALLHASIAARRAGRGQDAVRVAERLCALHFRWPPGQLALALALASVGEAGRAEEALDFDDTAVSARVAAEARVEAARFWTAQARDRGALFQLEAARDLLPGWGLVRLELAASLLRFGNVDAALDAANAVAWLDPRLFSGGDAVREVPVAPADVDALVAALVGAASGPNDDRILAAVAVVQAHEALRLGRDLPLAEQRLRAALALKADPAGLHAMLGKVLLARGQDADALEHLTLALTARESGALLAAAALAQARLGRGGEVEALLRRARAMAADGTVIAWHEALAKEALGDVAGARDAAVQALAEDPTHVEARAALARLTAAP